MNCSKITMEELRLKTQPINLFMPILNYKFKKLLLKKVKNLVRLNLNYIYISK